MIAAELANLNVGRPSEKAPIGAISEAQAAGVTCRSRTFDGDDSEIVKFIISKNLMRRHLNASQRAMIAAELATMQSGARTDLGSNDARSDAQAAALLNVSEKSVERAKAVRREAIPEVAAAVKAGDLSVAAAVKLAKEPKQKQRFTVKRWNGTRWDPRKIPNFEELMGPLGNGEKEG